MDELFEALEKDIRRVEASCRATTRFARCEEDRMILAHVFMHLEDACRLLKKHRGDNETR